MTKEIIISPPALFERIIYWIVILVLVGVLVYLLMHPQGASSSLSSSKLNTGVGTNATSLSNVTNVSTTSSPKASSITTKASCTDGTKNQNEVDVDCGGACATCGIGKHCISDSDCKSANCVSSKCANALSGKISLVLKDVKYVADSSSPAKVTSVKITITNGRSETANLMLEIYVLTENELYYLNQIQQDELDKNYKPYATIPLNPLASGKILEQTYDLKDHYAASSYLYSLTGNYKGGDSFVVQIRLVDRDTGNTLGTVKRKVSV